MAQSFDKTSYTTLVRALKSQRKGITVADLTLKTALPLETVRELVLRAADEYSGRLEVTESGEILYSFPRGFSSRYRSLKARLDRFSDAFFSALTTVLSTVFKIWIMVMLVGYFVLFILIALAVMVLSVAASSAGNNRNRRSSSGGLGGMYLASRLFNMMFRFWFYSELFSPRRESRWGGKSAKAGKPLYKKIFSFVFGEGDPNPDWETVQAQAVLGYIQAHRGVISLPEFMFLTGKDPLSADRDILGYCARYGGSPEATDDGTVVYRFDSLLLKAARDRLPVPPLKKPWTFSSNTGNGNFAYAVINGVNLAFGSYFLYFSSRLPALMAGIPQEHSGMFLVVYNSLAAAGINPAAFIGIGLGFVPVAFSLFFWFIPAIRAMTLGGKNRVIDRENSRRRGFRAVWERPENVTEDILGDGKTGPESAALLKEIGTYSVPDVAIDDRGQTVYAFTSLDEERKALEKYRAGIDLSKSDLGKTVFDTE